jgi:hypothetical protein
MMSEIRAHVATSETSTISLAPAAGAGIGKLLFDGLLARPDFIASMIEAAVGGLQAKIYFYTKDGVKDKPDNRTRIQALVMLLCHAEGEPIKRVIHQHLGAGGALDLVGAIHESPALRESLRHALEKAEFRGRNKRADPVSSELATVSELPPD